MHKQTIQGQINQLRNLMPTNIEIMEQVSSFFKVENDFFIKLGKKRGGK